MFLEYVEGVPDGLFFALVIVGALIILCTIVSCGVSIWLAISYVRYNRTENSIHMTGEEAARKILDKHDCENIRVKCTGSLLFGNSYSHYFKKVRLRRFTYRKKSVTSLAMAAQKSSLAVLDREGDPAMKSRVVLTPIVFFGPIAFIPMVILGAVLDIVVFNTAGICTLIFSALGGGIYILAFILQILQLKTERLAQKRAYEILSEEHMATEEELADMKKLFHLYNIEYVNNMILAMLELIWRILYAIAKSYAKGNSK